MQQTKKAKRIGAIARYEEAIARHNSLLESATFRFKGYQKSLVVGERTLLLDQLVTITSEIIAEESAKITNLKEMVYHTSQKLGYGYRGL